MGKLTLHQAVVHSGTIYLPGEQEVPDDLAAALRERGLLDGPTAAEEAARLALAGAQVVDDRTQREAGRAVEHGRQEAAHEAGREVERGAETPLKAARGNRA